MYIEYNEKIIGKLVVFFFYNCYEFYSIFFGERIFLVYRFGYLFIIDNLVVLKVKLIVIFLVLYKLFYFCVYNI